MLSRVTKTPVTTTAENKVQRPITAQDSFEIFMIFVFKWLYN